MPFFRYKGEKREMRNVYGFDFSNHKVVEIPEENTLAIKKLSGNSHFEQVEPVEEEPEQVEPVEEEQKKRGRPPGSKNKESGATDKDLEDI